MAGMQRSSPPKVGRAVRTGAEKMQMNHLRTRLEIVRIQKESAERLSTGRPVHPKIVRRG